MVAVSAAGISRWRCTSFRIVTLILAAAALAHSGTFLFSGLQTGPLTNVYTFPVDEGVNSTIRGYATSGGSAQTLYATNLKGIGFATGTHTVPKSAFLQIDFLDLITEGILEGHNHIITLLFIAEGAGAQLHFYATGTSSALGTSISQDRPISTTGTSITIPNSSLSPVAHYLSARSLEDRGVWLASITVTEATEQTVPEPATGYVTVSGGLILGLLRRRFTRNFQENSVLWHWLLNREPPAI
jgi:hypothetical protein